MVLLPGSRGPASVNIICIKKDLTCCMNLICCRDNIKPVLKVGDIEQDCSRDTQYNLT